MAFTNPPFIPQAEQIIKVKELNLSPEAQYRYLHQEKQAEQRTWRSGITENNRFLAAEKAKSRRANSRFINIHLFLQQKQQAEHQTLIFLQKNLKERINNRFGRSSEIGNGQKEDARMER